MQFILFDQNTYFNRRKILAGNVGQGLIWLQGNFEAPKNFLDNTYPFRQDSSFLYYAGLNIPDLSLLIDLDSGETFLCGDDRSVILEVWMGPQPTLREMASMVGISEVMTQEQMIRRLSSSVEKGQPIHYLPAYRGDAKIRQAQLLQKSIQEVESGVSGSLIQAVISQRSVKEEQELRQMEEALRLTRDMHLEVMYETREGLRESDLVAYLMKVVHAAGVDSAYPVILTVDGQILHNHYHGNILKDGQLLLGDFGAESPMAYAGDITRTLPVSGKFSVLQKDIYDIVLSGQETAIKMLSPGIPYRDIHLATARKMAEGLVAMGLLKGDVDEIVAEGAHALFFPHGLGHMIGLDVHDMEDLGEDYLGYDEEFQRSSQFGLRSLRFGKRLFPGLVLTVEPGIYFIPALIRQWENEGRCKHFVRYDKLTAFLQFGGIRIEDNYVITENGSRLLGPPIPKKAEDIEFLMSTGKELL